MLTFFESNNCTKSKKKERKKEKRKKERKKENLIDCKREIGSSLMNQAQSSRRHHVVLKGRFTQCEYFLKGFHIRICTNISVSF